MRAIRPTYCLLVLALGMAMQWSLTPLFAGGPSTVDITLLILIWFALIDRVDRVILLLLLVVILRTIYGVSPPLMVALPLSAALIWTRAARRFVDSRDDVRRIVITLGALFIAGLLNSVLLTGHWTRDFYGILAGVAYSSIAGILLFPILDELIPFLRSPRYPM